VLGPRRAGSSVFLLPETRRGSSTPTGGPMVPALQGTVSGGRFQVGSSETNEP
jgi:hypothetical protein